MTTSWSEFEAVAPKAAAVFRRRHAATGNLCMLATLRRDGFPRISPMEPRFFEDKLWIGGMPHTTKFADLARDPRFCLHTATVDTRVGDGDAKLWGIVVDHPDPDLHARFAQDVFEDIGLDIRGQPFPHCYAAEITGAASLEILDGQMRVSVWRPGEPERVVDVNP